VLYPVVVHAGAHRVQVNASIAIEATVGREQPHKKHTQSTLEESCTLGCEAHAPKEHLNRCFIRAPPRLILSAAHLFISPALVMNCEPNLLPMLVTAGKFVRCRALHTLCCRLVPTRNQFHFHLKPIAHVGAICANDYY
jgi:hypothetical protein